MSTQENENAKKDLPNKDLKNSENPSEENKKENPGLEGTNEKQNEENAFSGSSEKENTTKLEDEDHLEKAMLKETDSSALRAESQKKEKEYSNGLKNNNITSGQEEISDKAPQSPETATTPEKSTEVIQEEADAPVEGAKETSEKDTPENTIPSPVQPTTSQDYPGEEEEDEEEEAASKGKKDAHSEFEDSVAEDSEDETTHERHGIEKKDYHSMTKEELVKEFEHLLNKEKIQAIKEHVEEIKTEFNAKFDEEVEEKKEEFLAEGGNIIDFHYSTPLKKQFNSLYFDYKEKRNNYYQQLKQDLNKNLSKRLEIIEELKGLLGVEENINTTYKHFKELQDRWRTAGPIPKDKYNTVWNTYHHHVENFYDFLHLNREFRDMDFKHNLEQKLKVIDRAEELTQEKDTSRAFRELQMLHKMWKEELGPVAKEFREDIWNRFSEATKKIHDLRQAYYDQLDQQFEKNLEVKQELITKIQALAETPFTSHNQWQQKIKELEELRDQFFKAGKVPREKNEETWSAFKQSVRQFNRNKNSYYKGLKKEQYENLEKKRELIRIAEENKDNEDFKATTPVMKKIQLDWKKVGHVPRKDSDKVWKQFKAACNHYFERLHKSTTEENSEEQEAFDKKKEILDNLKTAEFTGDKKTDLPKIKAAIEEWKNIGKVPYNKRFIEGKFNKLLDQLFSKLDVDNNKVEMMKYENKIHALNEADDDKKLRNEHYFLTKKVEETIAEIRQLENNLQFFANVDDDNPLVQEVHKNIQDHKEHLNVWKEKLQKIKSLY
ncbi:MAG TPA: DUF349 domain-containing protein [Gillisia sp.]|nr:DUF349 domain-containing protein [Gillisia sp.]